MIVLAAADATAIAMGPNGEIGRQAGEISGHGGIVGSVTVAAVDADPAIHPDGKRSWRWVSDLDLRLPGTTALVHTAGAMTRELPQAGDPVQAFYAPGDPELGAVVHTNVDGQFDGRPAEGRGFTICVVIFSTLGLAFGAGIGAGRMAPPKDGERMLRDDLRAGRARAVRALVSGSTRTETIASGRRIGSETTRAGAPLLTITPARGTTWEVSPWAGYDPSVLADDFAGAPGWIVWPERFLLFQEARKPLPLVFIADDGRMFWATADLSDYSTRSRLYEPAPSAEQLEENTRPPLRLPRYGLYHPVLHGPSALALGLAGAVAIWRLSSYPATLTSWLMWPVMLVLPWFASFMAAYSFRNMKTQRKVLPTVPTTVVDKVPRSRPSV
ncbi:hypothetical protein KGQ19_39955 [Catenulispora sp. NL8]|uniref:Uncharacterized protein n=2 Tax=Catenulispora pinistramenti TaxID=2705254 RepID=A0ABS5L491_9ACTN|nr:hypothetical protein [Catenulispora pinistramenti]MBS2553045.1 hypothetical protein [Catenulispora pinistramenti]